MTVAIMLRREVIANSLYRDGGRSAPPTYQMVRKRLRNDLLFSESPGTEELRSGNRHSESTSISHSVGGGAGGGV